MYYIQACFIAAKLSLNAHIKSYITGDVRCKNKHKSTITVNWGVQVEKKKKLSKTRNRLVGL